MEFFHALPLLLLVICSIMKSTVEDFFTFGDDVPDLKRKKHKSGHKKKKRVKREENGANGGKEDSKLGLTDNDKTNDNDKKKDILLSDKTHVVDDETAEVEAEEISMFEQELGLKPIRHHHNDKSVSPSMEAEEVVSNVVEVVAEGGKADEDNQIEEYISSYESTMNQLSQVGQLESSQLDMRQILILHLTFEEQQLTIKVRCNKLVSELLAKLGIRDAPNWVIYLDDLQMVLNCEDSLIPIVCLDNLETLAGDVVVYGKVMRKEDVDRELASRAALSQPDAETEGAEAADEEDDVVVVEPEPQQTEDEQFIVTLLLSEKIQYKLQVRPSSTVAQLVQYLQDRGHAGVRLSFDNEDLEVDTLIQDTELEDGDLIDVHVN